MSPRSVFFNAWTSLTFKNENGPFAAIATHMGLTWLAGLIYLDAVITPTGTAMVYTASTARMIIAMSENHHLPSFFKQLNQFHMPARALLFNTTIGILLLFSLSNLDQLIKFQSSAMMLAYSMGPCSFLALRYKLPHLPRPFKIPCPNLIAWVVFFLCNTLVYCSGWIICANMFTTLTIGCIAYLSNFKISNSIHIISKNIWLLTHWFLLACISFLGNHEGIAALPHGIDYLLLAVESGVILYWSVLSSVSTESMQKYLI